MQKFRCLWWYGIIGAITGAALFLVTSVRLFAAEASSEEVYFTHTHADACYKEAIYSCESRHTCWSGYVEHKALYCSTCGTSVNHKVVCDSWNCPATNLYWQMNVVATCTACGNVQPAWSSGYNPAAHQQTGKQIACGLSEGEQTLGIRIIADASPTNSGVTLMVSENVIKEDTLNGTISYDWGGNSRSVTENGTYSVTATSSTGQSVTTSITIGCIDKTAPVIHSVTHDAASVTQNSVTVTVSATDGESGLSDAAYSTDGGATWSTQSTFTVSEGKDVQLVVRDKAGNTVTQVIKRSAFPYPPKPTPAPTPVPTPVPTPKPVATAIPPQQSGAQSAPSAATATPAAGSATQGEDIASSNTGAEKEDNTILISDSHEGKDTEDEKEDKLQDKVADDKESTRDAETMEEDELEMVEVEEEVPMVAKPFLDADEESERAVYGQGGESTDPDKESEIVSTGKNPGSVSENGIGQGVLYTIGSNTGDTGLGNDGFDDSGAGSDGSGNDGTTSLHDVSLQKMLPIIGATLIGLLAVVLLVVIGRFLWQNSAVLYCYDGGDEYKKLGLFFLRKKEDGVELYLPEYLTETTDILRYRLLLKNGLVKKFAGSDLVVYSEDTELRRPLEECVDFVL